MPQEALDPKPTEAKTLSDIAVEVNKWTLHADHELYSYLKKYSTDLFDRTKRIEDNVRDIAMDAEAAHVRLKNTFNQFLMLCNNQFIENRVYDEEQQEEYVEDTKQESNDTETSTTQSGNTQNDNTVKSTSESIVSKYRSALDMGIEAMKLFAMMYDDDDDTDTTASDQFDTVLDIYNERPLPYIIGTREFLEDDTLGLGAPPESDSSSESESDIGSYSSSDESQSSDVTRKKQSNTRHFESESDSNSNTFSRSQPRQSRSSSAYSDTSGLFGTPPTSDEKQDSKQTSERKQRMKTKVEEVSESDSEWSSASESEKEDSTDDRPLSSRKREDSSDNSTPKTNLFDNSDSSEAESEHGLFGSAPKTQNAGDQNANSLFAELQKKVPKYDKENSSLFEEQQATKQETNTSLPPRSNSYDSQSSSDGLVFGRKKETLFKMEKHSKSKSLRSSTSSKQFFHDSESDSDSDPSGLFGSKPKKISPPVPKSSNSDDGIVDDGSSLFGISRLQNANERPLGRNSSSKKKVSICDSSDDDDDSGGLFGSVTPPASFDENNSNLSTETSKNMKTNPSGSAKAALPPSKPLKSPIQYKASLFDKSGIDNGSDSRALFGSKKPLASSSFPTPTPFSTQKNDAPKPVPSRILGENYSDSSDGDDGLFGPQNAATTHLPLNAVTQSLPAADPPRNTNMLNSKFTKSIRGSTMDSDRDEDWNDGGLFGSAPTTKNSAAPSFTSVPSATLISTQESSAMSLFGPASSTSQKQQPPNPSTASRLMSTREESESSDEWSDDGDSLFGASKKK